MQWADEIIDENKDELTEENLEKAILEIFNNDVGEEEPTS